MLKLAENFAKGRNLKDSYNKLIQILEKLDMRTEECFTMESLCRILKTKKEKEQIVQKIVEINAIGLNSYDTYCMNLQPVQHEFPIENKNPIESAIVLIMDRYMALMHIIALLKKSEVQEVKKIIKFVYQVEKEFKFKTTSCLNDELIEHVRNVMSAGEMLVGTNIKNYDDIELLLEAINFGYREENVYLKILKIYQKTNKIRNAMKFYNEYYAPLFNKEIYKKLDKFERFLTDELSVE